MTRGEQGPRSNSVTGPKVIPNAGLTLYLLHVNAVRNVKTVESGCCIYSDRLFQFFNKFDIFHKLLG